MNTVFIYYIKITIMGQIRDIMEKNVITIGHDKSSLDAAKLISEKDISFLVVVKDGNPIGVVSERIGPIALSKTLVSICILMWSYIGWMLT